MKFNEAMDLLRQGQRVTRTPWLGSIYFVMDNDSHIKSYQPRLVNYIYDEDIMLSEGWVVEDKEGEHRFCDIIPFLQEGLKAKLNDWKDSYIFLDKSTRVLVLFGMEIFAFVPDFESFTAEDWIQVE